MKKETQSNLKKFESKWVALVEDTVVASGDTVKEVKEKADRAGAKEYVFYFVPSSATSFAPAIVWD